MVYGIISRHGGWVDVSSEKGKGTTFKVCFPALTGKEKEAESAEPASEVGIGQGERILVVEDEEDVRKYAVKALRKHGYAVFAASNGRTAMDTFIKEGGNFDLVFCDVVLPDCHGPDLVNSFRDIRSGFEVLLTSGYPNYRNPEVIKKKTRYDLLPKPYSMNSLVESIYQALKKRN